MYLRRLRADAVEKDGEKADRDVQDLAGDLVSVNLPTSAVDLVVWRAYSRMTAISGGWESSPEDLGFCSFPSSNSCLLALAIGGRLRCWQAA